MIPDRRSSWRGLYLAVSLLAALSVALAARPVAAAPRSSANTSPAAQISASFPTRIEGYIQSISGKRWLVDQTPVVLGPQTTVIETRGVAEVGAFVLVAGLRFADRLEADTIEVLRKPSDPIPSYQFTGMLRKQASEAWTIEDVAVDIDENTKVVGDIVPNGLVRVTVQRIDGIRLLALEVKAIAPDAASLPVAIEGTLEQVTDDTWVVDSQSILVPPEHALSAGQGDTVEVAAVKDEAGILVAQETNLVNASSEAQLDGYVTEVNGLGEDIQTWTVQVFESGQPTEQHTIRVRPETYVDEDRAVIEPHVEAQVRGVKVGEAGIEAALITLEQPTPAAVAGELTMAGAGELWHVGNQPVWFESKDLRQAAEAAATVSATAYQGAAAAKSRSVVVQGVRLSNGVLIAQAVLTHDAAAAAGVVPTEASTVTLNAADWYGPTSITPSLSKASKPTVLFDSAQGGHAVYESLNKVYYAYQPPGGAWEPPRKIGTGSRPVATFDSKGELHVAYASQFLNDIDILHVRLTSRGWTLPQVVASTTGSSEDPAIVADAGGKVYLAWMDFTSGEWAIQIGAWNGSYWTSYPVSNARGKSPTVAVMPGAGLSLAWQDRIPLGIDVWGNVDIFESEFISKERGWTLPVNVSDNRTYRPGTDSLGARMTTTAYNQGLAHIAWIDDQVQVRYVYGRGSYWPIPVDVTGRRPLARGLSLQMAADGLLYLAWDEGATVHVTASTAGLEPWAAAITVATRSTAVDGGVSDVSLSSGGKGVAVSWVQENLSGDMGVYESRYNMQPLKLKCYIPWVTRP